MPRAHYLEYWGDGRSSDGTYVGVQPMILPLFGGWSDNDVLAKFAGLQKPTGPELVQDTFRQIAGSAAADFDTAWNKFLHDGFLTDSAAPTGKALSFAAAAAGTFIADQANLPALGGPGITRSFSRPISIPSTGAIIIMAGCRKRPTRSRS